MPIFNRYLHSNSGGSKEGQGAMPKPIWVQKKSFYFYERKMNIWKKSGLAPWNVSRIGAFRRKTASNKNSRLNNFYNYITP